MKDLHQITTDRICAQLKAGVVPWRRPWSKTAAADAPRSSGLAMPRNAVTDRPYSGVNILLLWGRMDDGQFSDGRFLTFKQAKELGASVRKGERGCEVVFVNFVERPDRVDPSKTARVPFLKSYYVFNVAQCDNMPAKMILDRGDGARARAPVKRNERDATIDEFAAATRATIRHGEPRAFYTTAGDYVNMPVFDSFISGHAYYATLFHELGHWTGAETRLNRTFGRRFGDRAYAAEELVAELASAFVCAEFGIDNDGQDAAYIATWLKAFESNANLLVTAASAASKAVEFLRGLASAAAPVDLPAVDLPLAA